MIRAIPLIFITACAPIDQKPRLAAPDYLDAASTTVGLAQGFSEANQLLSWAGPATPLVSLSVKYGVKWGLVKAGIDAKTANRSVETASSLAGCSNIALMAGAAFPANLAVGAVCGLVYWEITQ